MWRTQGGALWDLGVLTKLDEPAFFALCETYERYRRAKRSLAEQGYVVETTAGNLIQNPHLGIMNTALKQLIGMMARFGMTPTDRARLDIPDAETTKNREWFFGDRPT